MQSSIPSLKSPLSSYASSPYNSSVVSSIGGTGTTTATSTATQSPLVLLLDFDGTIVGNVEWLGFEYSLIEQLNESVARHRIKHPTALVKQDIETSGLLRPYFKTFMRYMKKYHSEHSSQPIELFVYTASDTEWANYILPRVETITGVKFNRPFLTRKHCIQREKTYYKSVKSVQPLVIKSLQKKYPHVSKWNRIFLVDNTPNVLLEKELQLLCPDYSKDHVIDVVRHFRQRPYSSFIEHALWNTLRNCVQDSSLSCLEIKEGLPVSVHKSLLHSRYYSWLAQRFTDVYKRERKEATGNHKTKDVFWKQFVRFFMKTDISRLTAQEIIQAYYSKKHANSLL